MVDFEGKYVKLLLIVLPDESTSQRVQPAWEEAETLAVHSGGGEYSAHTGRTVEGELKEELWDTYDNIVTNYPK